MNYSNYGYYYKNERDNQYSGLSVEQNAYYPSTSTVPKPHDFMDPNHAFMKAANGS